MASDPLPPDKFDRLFAAGSRAVLDGAVRCEKPPVDGGTRWGLSVVLRPDRGAAPVLARLTDEAMALAGAWHWPTGTADSSHFTVRSLERPRESVLDGDPAIARYLRALRAAAARSKPIGFRLSGVTMPDSCVMACAEAVDGAVDDFAAALAEELGGDAWHEDGFNRDIWYATLIHFTGPVDRPAELVEWVRERRRADFGSSTAAGAQLVQWRFGGSGVLPRVLADVPLGA
jgi:hypothetical protein